MGEPLGKVTQYAPRLGVFEPITPLDAGLGWLIVCQTCGFRCDASGPSAEAALHTVAQQHQGGHVLTGGPVDYSQHPLYEREVAHAAAKVSEVRPQRDAAESDGR